MIFFNVMHSSAESRDRTLRLRLKINNDKVYNRGVGPIAFSPDGHTLASSISTENFVMLLDAETGVEFVRFVGRDIIIKSMAFSPDGTKIVWTSRKNTINVWDVQGRKEIGVLEGHSEPVFSVAFAPDGKMLASGSRDKTVALWDVATMKQSRSMAGHQDYVMSVAFSPDGKMLASGSSDGTTRLWDAANGAEIDCLKSVDEAASKYVAFTPDGTRLVTAGPLEKARLWTLTTRTTEDIIFRRNSYSYDGDITCITFSPDGAWLAAGTDDGVLRLWNSQHGFHDEFARYLHRDGIESIAFSPDSRTLASSAEDHVYLWDISALI